MSTIPTFETGRAPALERAPLGTRVVAALRRAPVEGTLVVVALLVAWEWGARTSASFLFPPLEAIGSTLVTTLSDPAALASIALTYARIVLALVVTFLFATALGLWAGVSARVDRGVAPLIQIKQAVPGICWAIFAIIWFRSMELRVFFVVAASTLPLFFYQARDGLRAIPADLWEMMRALRPTRVQTLTKLVLPALVPSVLVGWRVNLGTAARVTVTAELLAGVSGIGHALRNAQEQFRMDEAIAWTVVLAVFVLTTDRLMTVIERWLLAWRPDRRATEQPR